jgi:hypothetical protein
MVSGVCGVWRVRRGAYALRNARLSLELLSTVLRREMEMEGGGRVAAVRARMESRNSTFVR